MEYRLEELFDLQMGKTPSRSVTEYWESGNNKWISIADLSKCGKYIYDTKECLSDIAVSESGIKQIPANTVVMSFKLSIGKTAITSEPMYSNEAIMSFRDRKLVQLLPEYIYYLLLSKNWDDGTNKAVMGKTLNKATLSKVKVNIHSMQEQQEIVYVLNQATALIELHQQQLQKLDELVKARFVEMFGDDKYSKMPLINLITEGAGLSYGIVQPGDSGTGDMGVLRPVDMVNGEISTHSIKYIDRSIGASFKKTELVGDELLITVRGTTGVTALTDSRFKNMNVTRGIAVIRYDRRKINPIYLNAFLNTDESQQYIQEHTRGATLQQINLSDLRVHMIPVPPIELQEKLADFIQQVDKSKVAVQKSLDEAQLLFDSLMQQYFG